MDPDYSEYSLDRQLIFDTSARSYLPPKASRLLPSSVARVQGGASSAQMPVIFAGETHSNPMHHHMQLDIIRAANALSDQPLVIGLEMFWRQQQHILDDYVFGDDTVAELYSRTQWKSKWGYDFNQYAKIFQYAKANQVRLLGLNVPLRFMDLVMQYGLAELPEELQSFLPDMDFGNRAHRERFTNKMAVMSREHGGYFTEARLNRYYEAMVVWDEYMAETAADHLQAHPGDQMVVLAGSNHIEERNGLPDRLARRTGAQSFTVLPQSVPWERGSYLPAIERPLDHTSADWIWYTQLEVGER